jgi:hypothetical protein
MAPVEVWRLTVPGSGKPELLFASTARKCGSSAKGTPAVIDAGVTIRCATWTFKLPQPADVQTSKLDGLTDRVSVS